MSLLLHILLQKGKHCVPPVLKLNLSTMFSHSFISSFFSAPLGDILSMILPPFLNSVFLLYTVKKI